MSPEQVEALALSRGLVANPSSLERVGAATTPEAARWAFAQWALRSRARAKFALAEEMLFDRDGLEMASHEQVAAYHASCFPPGELVIDRTCGIGADLIALARRGPAVGYDLDPERVEYARHNLAVRGLEGEVIVGDGSTIVARYAFCDPSRRQGGRRSLDPTQFSPSPFQVAKLGGPLLLKLSPLLSDSILEELGGELEFLSFGGECREALVACNGLRSGSGRRARHLESGSILVSAGVGPRQESAKGWLFEADPAAIRAHALGTLCGQLDLALLGDSNGYLTAHARVTSVWLRGYEVLADHPADVKRTRAVLRELRASAKTIKSRAPGVDVIALGRALKGDGEPLVVAVYPVGSRLRHVVCRPGPTPPPGKETRSHSG